MSAMLLGTLNHAMAPVPRSPVAQSCNSLAPLSPRRGVCIKGVEGVPCCPTHPAAIGDAERDPLRVPRRLPVERQFVDRWLCCLLGLHRSASGGA